MNSLFRSRPMFLWVISLIHWLYSISYIYSGWWSSIRYLAGKDDLPFCGLPLHMAGAPFAVQKFFSFMKSHLPIVGLHPWTNRVLFTMSFPTPMSCIALPMFLPEISVFWFHIWVFDYLLSVFVQSDRHQSNFILLNADNLFTLYHLLNLLSFLQIVFLASLFNSKWPKLCVWMLRSWFYSIIKSYDGTNVT